jgi:ketosteroid isomerase-like protein
LENVMNPVELVERALHLLLLHDMAAFADLWAENGVLEFPFAQPGAPQRLEGRAAVREYLRGYPDVVDVREIPERVVHRTEDPDVLVVEFTAGGVVVATGEPYSMRYIAVITVRDGEIRHYRDYWSPAAAAEIMTGALAGTPNA